MQLKNVTTILRVIAAIGFIGLGISIALAPSEWASVLYVWARVSIFGSMKPFVQLVSLLHILTGMGIAWTKTARLASIVGAVLSIILLLTLGGGWVSYIILAVVSIVISLRLGRTSRA